jgi:hypothetical protein
MVRRFDQNAGELLVRYDHDPFFGDESVAVNTDAAMPVNRLAPWRP